MIFTLNDNFLLLSDQDINRFFLEIKIEFQISYSTKLEPTTLIYNFLSK